LAISEITSKCGGRFSRVTVSRLETCMRRVLVDRARARAAAKRNPEEFVLTEARAGRSTSPEELLDLDLALEKLAAEHPRLAKVVEMRYFAGLELTEIGEVLAISERTVKRDWAFARAWLLAELEGRVSPPDAE
jgi:RNA polymerase sigma-70 factor, ECF subfamily